MEYRQARNEDDLLALAPILSEAFGHAPDAARTWIKDAGDDEARLLWRDDALLGGFLRRPMGQWWGNRSVPMVGIAAVGIASEHRGGGAATTLMHEAIREMHADGVPLSVLFAASFTLYRRAGYETAGTVHQISASLIPLQGDRTLALRAATPEDKPALRALQAETVRHRNGTLDRSDTFWKYQMKNAARTHVVEVDGRIDGYIAHSQAKVSGDWTLIVHDIAARHHAAGRRLLGFMADHKAQLDRAAWKGDIADPIVSLLHTGRYRIKMADPWMLRVVDVKKALEARGYPVGLSASLEFEVEDDLIEGNNGRWTLTIADGTGTVRDGGSGAVRTTIRGFAPLYTGFLPARSLRQSGWIEADDETCAVAEAIFAGSAPFMSEPF